MNRKEIVQGITEYLRANDVRKTVSSPKHKFTISDDTGAKKNFVIQQSEKRVLYGREDVEAILDAFLEVVWDAFRKGESVALRGLGTFWLKYKKPYKNIHPGTGEWVTFGGTYKPAFTPARRMNICAKVYELSTKESRETCNLTPDCPEDGDEDGN